MEGINTININLLFHLFTYLLFCFRNSASTGKSTYFYEFEHSLYTKDSWVTGTHSEDLPMVFGSRIFSFDEDDELVKRNIQAYYTNFAYTGRVVPLL